MANANYAAGRCQEALECLDAMTAVRGDSKHNQIVAWLCYSLAHARLGNADKARGYLKMSKDWMNENLNSGKVPPGWAFAPHWSYHLDLARLRKEGERLLKGP